LKKLRNWKVWSGEWRYEEQSSMCLRMWFDPGDNPNAKVAAYWAERLAKQQQAAAGRSNITVPDDDHQDEDGPSAASTAGNDSKIVDPDSSSDGRVFNHAPGLLLLSTLGFMVAKFD
jgi:hypothetical protein